MTFNPDNYRPCVGVAIFNAKGKIWLGKRFGENGPYTWQMPQGGIDEGETPQDAAARELFEETGITTDMVAYLGSIKNWLHYDFPPEYRTKKSWKWNGQRQRWFAYRFHGDVSKIDLQSHGPQEFSEWKWADLKDTPSLIVPFKRDVYDQLVVEFERYTHPVN